MKIIEKFPPNYEMIHRVLGEWKDAIYCYGDTIYNPYKKEVTPDLEAHESVHTKQQGDDIEGWWYTYLTDPSFRLAQEVEAYGTQYAFAKSHGVKGKMLEWLKENMGRALSGESYGSLLSQGEAESRIRNFID